MKAKEAKLGARVTSRNGYYNGFISSNNVSGSDDETVIVEWQNHNLEKCNVNELKFSLEVLEDEWQAVQTKINTAKHALSEANNLLSRRGDKSNLREWESEGLISLDEFFTQLDHAGWNTSSMTRDC